MIGKLLAPLYFRKEFDLPFDGDAERGARTLSSAVKNPYRLLPSGECLVGGVSPSGVEIWRFRPSVRNAFKPVFHGRFVAGEGGGRLEGEFRISPAAKAFIAGWTILLMLISILLLAILFLSGSGPGVFSIVFLLAPAALLLFGIALLRIGWAAGKPDIEYIEKKLADILKEG
jgi:hypothetical protein